MPGIRQSRTTITKIRTYYDVRRLRTFEERFDYLKLGGEVGTSTFGFDRWLNQRFYNSPEWQSIRREVILRDGGCDLGIPGYEIHKGLYVHHMNPISRDDIIHGDERILDLNYLITVSLKTHNAIHFGDDSRLPRGPIERKPGDTKLW
jgi:hypothetical protein